MGMITLKIPWRCKKKILNINLVDGWEIKKLF